MFKRLAGILFGVFAVMALAIPAAFASTSHATAQPFPGGKLCRISFVRLDLPQINPLTGMRAPREYVEVRTCYYASGRVTVHLLSDPFQL